MSGCYLGHSALKLQSGGGSIGDLHSPSSAVHFLQKASSSRKSEEAFEVPNQTKIPRNLLHWLQSPEMKESTAQTKTERPTFLT